MTREEVIEMMVKQDGKAGFFVVSVENDDIEFYGDEELQERFFKMKQDIRKCFLSVLANRMGEMFELGDEYGFRKLMQDTLADPDISMDDMIRDAYDAYDEAEKENENTKEY